MLQLILCCPPQGVSAMSIRGTVTLHVIISLGQGHQLTIIGKRKSQYCVRFTSGCKSTQCLKTAQHSFITMRLLANHKQLTFLLLIDKHAEPLIQFPCILTKWFCNSICQSQTCLVGVRFGSILPLLSTTVVCPDFEGKPSMDSSQTFGMTSVLCISSTEPFLKDAQICFLAAWISLELGK